MAGLVPAIHVFLCRAGKQDVDARDKRGHDDGEADQFERKYTGVMAFGEQLLLQLKAAPASHIWCCCTSVTFP